MAEKNHTPSDEGAEGADASRAAAPSETEGSDIPEIDGNAIRAKVDRAFELVPGIGTRWRWYDIPYRLLSWSLSSWRRRLLHWRLRRRLNNALNFFISFNEYERMKVEPRDDPMENLIVPSGEKLRQGAIWLVEFFPPSRFSSLDEALRKNGWDQQNVSLGLDAPNADQVARARRRSGFAWRRLGAVVDPRAPYAMLESKREVLPSEFASIELTAVQVGSSLTAVFAFISLSKSGGEALGSVWAGDRVPWSGGVRGCDPRCVQPLSWGWSGGVSRSSVRWAMEASER